MRLKIKFDDDNFGGFTVIEGQLEHVPYGWEEVSPGRFEPKWPPCRYRNLSKSVRNERINTVPHCQVYKGPVTFDQCMRCDRHRPPLEYIGMTPEIAEAIKDGRIDNLLIPPTEDPDPILFPGMAQPEPTPWLPCKHRYDHQGENDCCIKPHCGNKACEKFEKKVRKRICKLCEHREE